jgi:uncharacterized membrane protein YdjX (TVP38/TMEM64 family)
MRRAPGSLRHALTWAEWMPSLRLGVCVLTVFGVAVLLAQVFALPIQAALAAHPRLAVGVFVGTSVVAVLVPVLSNLALVPLVVPAWGPVWTALLLLLGWVIGAVASFLLGRFARELILRRFPSVHRHVNIDRLIHPGHRIGSLILLRMTFPVDVLSYALGLFSSRTHWVEVAVSTVVGGAPFAMLFALYPALPPMIQLLVFGACTLVFVAYALWTVHRPPASDSQPGAKGGP